MKILSPSKINLGLRIVGRRTDGYHLLESLFWPINLVDEIELKQSSQNSIETIWAPDAPITSELPTLESHSISKLLTKFPELGTWSIKITKRIPIGGGLGGSSSNVGSVLKYFRNYERLDNEKAKSMALSIGADVPYFLDPVPTWVEGIGEKRTLFNSLSENHKLDFHLILIDKPCLTKDVFGKYKDSNFPFSKSTQSIESLKDFLSSTKNDLESSASNVVPLIGDTLKFLRQFSFDYVGLSGSGSTCFAVSGMEAMQEDFSKDLQQFCRNSKCRYIKASTFVAH